jgi:hypothetical protein
MILKGREIITGGSFIMPMDMRHAGHHHVDDEKGQENHKPMIKARFSSLVM